MLNGIAQGALAALVAAPVLMAGVAWSLGPRKPMLVGRLGAWVAGLCFAGTSALAVVGGAAVGTGVAALAADRVAIVLLLLVFGISTVVQAFSVRYLAGDPRATWFTAGAALLTAASAGLVTATTLVGLAVGWTAAGMALCLLLATYRQLPAARDGVRRTATAFLIGDAALWAAVGLVAAQRGTVNLRELAAQPPTGLLAAVVAVLVVVAALSRSAQFPFHRWLPTTLAAPTPVSALLHAGVVNAGGILLVRLYPLGSAGIISGLAIAAGAATMAYGAVIMLVKPDVKGALAHSTTAQMGFMMLTCGLGLWAAAVIHLVAHGFYKATLFLSTGSAIAHRRRVAALPPARPLTGHRRGVAMATAVLLPLVALVGAATLLPQPHGSHASAHALLLFAWVTGAAATWGWLQRRTDPRGIVGAAAFLIPAAFAYIGVVNALSTYLAPDLPLTALPGPTAWLIVAIALIALAGLAALRWSSPTNPLHRTLYARALSAGHLYPRPTGVRA